MRSGVAVLVPTDPSPVLTGLNCKALLAMQKEGQLLPIKALPPASPDSAKSGRGTGIPSTSFLSCCGQDAYLIVLDMIQTLRSEKTLGQAFRWKIRLGTASGLNLLL